MKHARLLLSVAALALSLTAQQSPPAPVEDLVVVVSATTTEVELGRPFGVTVELRWNETLEPEAWSDASLAPLVVRLQDHSRQQRAGQITETRRYQAYAFTSGEVVVPSPFVRAMPRDGGTERLAFADDLVVQVAPALPVNASPDAELAHELRPAPVVVPLWSISTLR